MNFVEMLNKALTDHVFADLVVTNPSAALSQFGIEPTQEKVCALQAATAAMLEAQAAIDGGQAIANI